MSVGLELGQGHVLSIERVGHPELLGNCRRVLCGEEATMDDHELGALGAAAEAGDRDAEDELVQGLAERGDAEGLRHWAQRGHSDAADHWWNSPRNARIATSSRG
jgi:hypothetical protein